MPQKNISIYLSYLLRHNPAACGLPMDRHGWVPVDALIEGVNRGGKYRLDREQLKQIVAADEKGRYRFSPDGARIKACQGHSLPWVEPELDYREPPEYLYHGTTADAAGKIRESGSIQKRKRHAVHMQAELAKAWQSAERWHKTPVVLKIAARQMAQDGALFGVTENGVWCTEEVPVRYIREEIASKTPDGQGLV